MEKAVFGALVAAASLRRTFVRHRGNGLLRKPEKVAVASAKKYSLEEVVHIAGQLAQYFRAKFVFGDGDAVFSKQDTSPVTVADVAIQVLVTLMLKKTLGVESIRLIGEEDIQIFADDVDGSRIAIVHDIVERFLPKDAGISLSESTIVDTLKEANDEGGDGSFWTLDPIDGTKGFILEGGQYATGLARVENGAVVQAIIGCPVLSSAYMCGDPRLLGCVYSATLGEGAFVRAVDENGTLGPPTPVRIPHAENRAEMRHTMSRAHRENAGVIEAVASKLGLHPISITIDSMVKFVLVARGEAHLYARSYFHVWDYAPGCLLVTEAGGQVTDGGGAGINFSVSNIRDREIFVVATASDDLHSATLSTIKELTSGPNVTPENRRISISDCD